MKTLLTVIALMCASTLSAAEYVLVNGSVQSGNVVNPNWNPPVTAVAPTHTEYRYVCNGTSCQRVAVTVPNAVPTAAVPWNYASCSTNCSCSSTGSPCVAGCPCAGKASMPTTFPMPMASSGFVPTPVTATGPALNTATPLLVKTRPVIDWIGKHRPHIFGRVFRGGRFSFVNPY